MAHDAGGLVVEVSQVRIVPRHAYVKIARRLACQVMSVKVNLERLTSDIQ
jgi:hypothetical protein